MFLSDVPIEETQHDAKTKINQPQSIIIRFDKLSCDNKYNVDCEEAAHTHYHHIDTNNIKRMHLVCKRCVKQKRTSSHKYHCHAVQ